MLRHHFLVKDIHVLVIQKYGGTSVGTPERILNVAKRVLETKRAGHDVVVVVSAMSGETNRLLALAHAIDPNATGREVDQLLASGEQVTVALLSLAFQQLGQPSKSFLAHQVKIVTDYAYNKARILSIDHSKISQALAQNQIVVIAGFQGITDDGSITTLGRGGSDTTAVAIAAAMNADLCEIYTDVKGIYTTDPRICPDAKKLDRISYEEMLELASAGAKVLQIRSVEFAAKYKVKLVVRSSFDAEEGTLVTDEDPTMEAILVSGITLDKSEAKVSIRSVPDQPGISSEIFGPIAEANINVDMIIQNTGLDNRADLTFTVPLTDLRHAVQVLTNSKNKIQFATIETDEDIAKVSIVGVGMRSHAGVAALAFKTLSDNKINIDMISTSEIKISLIVQKCDAENAVKALHDAFKLGA